MTCQTCNRGPADGVTVYRQNTPGEMPAVWACQEHGEVASAVRGIVETLEQLDLFGEIDA